MKKIEATIETRTVDTLREALAEVDIDGITISEVKCKGAASHFSYRGAQYSTDLAPRAEIRLLVRDEQVARCIDVIALVARTTEHGDGQILVFPVEDAIRIRTGECLVRQDSWGRRAQSVSDRQDQAAQ